MHVCSSSLWPLDPSDDSSLDDLTRFFDFFPDMVGFKVLGGRGRGYLLSDDMAFSVGCRTRLDFCSGMGVTTEELLR